MDKEDFVLDVFKWKARYVEHLASFCDLGYDDLYTQIRDAIIVDFIKFIDKSDRND